MVVQSKKKTLLKPNKLKFTIISIAIHMISMDYVFTLFCGLPLTLLDGSPTCLINIVEYSEFVILYTGGKNMILLNTSTHYLITCTKYVRKQRLKTCMLDLVTLTNNCMTVL